MSSQCFILNEWLLEDLLGHTSKQAHIQSLEFLETLRQKPDRIAVLDNSPWMKKAYELMKRNDPVSRESSKKLHYILRDSRKCQRLSRTELKPLPEDLKSKTPLSDLYLVETYFSVGADILITTDEKLRAALAEIPDTFINTKHRDEFLEKYLIGRNPLPS